MAARPDKVAGRTINRRTADQTVDGTAEGTAGRTLDLTLDWIDRQLIGCRIGRIPVGFFACYFIRLAIFGQ